MSQPEATPKAPAKALLLAVSIFFIIFGGIVLLISLLPLLGAGCAAIASIASTDPAVATVAASAAVIGSVLLALGAAELVLGIIGCSKAGKPSAAMYFIVAGIILCALNAGSLIWSLANAGFNWCSLAGMALPILYIVGGSMKKKAA